MLVVLSRITAGSSPALLSASPFILLITLGCCILIYLPTRVPNPSIPDPLPGRYCGLNPFATPLLGAASAAPVPAWGRGLVAVTRGVNPAGNLPPGSGTCLRIACRPAGASHVLPSPFLSPWQEVGAIHQPGAAA